MIALPSSADCYCRVTSPMITLLHIAHHRFPPSSIYKKASNFRHISRPTQRLRTVAGGQQLSAPSPTWRHHSSRLRSKTALFLLILLGRIDVDYASSMRHVDLLHFFSLPWASTPCSSDIRICAFMYQQCPIKDMPSSCTSGPPFFFFLFVCRRERETMKGRQDNDLFEATQPSTASLDEFSRSRRPFDRIPLGASTYLSIRWCGVMRPGSLGVCALDRSCLLSFQVSSRRDWTD